MYIYVCTYILYISQFRSYWLLVHYVKLCLHEPKALLPWKQRRVQYYQPMPGDAGAMPGAAPAQAGSYTGVRRMNNKMPI